MHTPQSLLLAPTACAALLLSACETTSRALPSYESPLARLEFQNVRATAYTHTETDHREFSNRNALGTELHAAGPGIRRAEIARATTVGASASDTALEPFSVEPGSGRKVATTASAKRSKYALPISTVYGSAAADWSRWPAGTIFRLLSTGQTYRVDDYGWALAGRNTIDLYMGNQHEMNAWGARQERIQVLQWGDPQESLRLLAPHGAHPHIKRMILELEGRDQEAASLK
ncbi:MAG: hypothetical protein ABI925_11555 [Verrucomicrobiota bacterium]